MASSAARVLDRTDHFGGEDFATLLDDMLTEAIRTPAAVWDATGAEVFGFKVAWCNRIGAPPETYGPKPTWTIASLDALPALIAGT